LLSACCLSLSGCDLIAPTIFSGGDDSVPKADIFKYATENVASLELFEKVANLSQTSKGVYERDNNA
jgi:hypothetical protein